MKASKPSLNIVKFPVQSGLDAPSKFMVTARGTTASPVRQATPTPPLRSKFALTPRGR